MSRSGLASLQLILRVDATADSGAGHAMRLAALAEQWRKLDIGGVWVQGTLTLSFVHRRLAEVGARFDGLEPGLPAVLMVDSYDAVVRREGAVALEPCLRVLVDDLGGPVAAGYDAVWNPNAYAAPSLYPAFRAPVWSGPDYVPLRSSLPTWRSPQSGRTAVVLGGGRVASPLSVAVRELPARAQGGQCVGVGEWVPANWECLPSENPWQEIVTCDRLLTAAGVTVWEAAAVGIPTAIVQTAANQWLVADWARAVGVPVVDALAISEPKTLADAVARATASARPLPTITNGAERVARRCWKLATARARRE